MQLLLWIGVMFSAVGQPEQGIEPLAAIRLYNPTLCADSGLVEVPVGSLATPGEIDWKQVRLMHGDEEVPFAIREGRTHWKAHFTAPVSQPRAEDLLVFSCAVPPHAWTQLTIVPGPQRHVSTLAPKEGRLAVSYPNLHVVIEEATGRLVELTAYDQPLLTEAMAISCFKLQDGKPPARQPLTPRVTLVSGSTTAAMTELNFLLALPDGCQIGLTYRLHAFGLVEILGDERPWQGISPWLDHQVEYALRLSGKQQTLPYLQNWAPAYGFPDYAASVKLVGTIYRAPRASVIEIGEETVNGRRWNRRLYVLPADKFSQVERMVKLATEGFVVEIQPVGVPLGNKSLAVIHSAEVSGRGRPPCASLEANRSDGAHCE